MFVCLFVCCNTSSGLSLLKKKVKLLSSSERCNGVMQLFKWCHAPIIHYIFHDGPFSNWGFLDLINSADLQIYAIELTSRQEVRFRETFFQNELKKCSTV